MRALELFSVEAYRADTNRPMAACALRCTTPASDTALLGRTQPSVREPQGFDVRRLPLLFVFTSTSPLVMPSSVAM